MHKKYDLAFIAKDRFYLGDKYMLAQSAIYFMLIYFCNQFWNFYGTV